MYRAARSFSDSSSADENTWFPLAAWTLHRNYLVRIRGYRCFVRCRGAPLVGREVYGKAGTVGTRVSQPPDSIHDQGDCILDTKPSGRLRIEPQRVRELFSPIAFSLSRTSSAGCNLIWRATRNFSSLIAISLTDCTRLECRITCGSARGCGRLLQRVSCAIVLVFSHQSHFNCCPALRFQARLGVAQIRPEQLDLARVWDYLTAQGRPDFSYGSHLDWRQPSGVSIARLPGFLASARPALAVV